MAEALAPGGAYRNHAGKWVDANGKEIDEPKAKSAAGAKDDGKAAEPVVLKDADELPAGFPGRDALVKAGIKTAGAVRAKADADIEALDGIGTATVAKIRDALKA